MVLYLVDHDDVVVRHVVRHHHVMISAEGNVAASEVVDHVLLELFFIEKKRTQCVCSWLRNLQCIREKNN